MKLELRDELAFLSLKLATNCVAALAQHKLLPEEQARYCAGEMRQFAEQLDRTTDPDAEVSATARQLHALAALIEPAA